MEIFMKLFALSNTLIAAVGIDYLLSQRTGHTWRFGPKWLSIELAKMLRFNSPALMMCTLTGVSFILNVGRVVLVSIYDVDTRLIVAIFLRLSIALDVLLIIMYYRMYKRGQYDYARRLPNLSRWQV